MSNSTTPSDKNSKKNGKVNQTNKDKHAQADKNAATVSNTNKDAMSDQEKSVSSPAEQSPTVNASNHKDSQSHASVSTNQKTDKIVEAEPDTAKPTDKMAESSPVSVPANDKKAEPKAPSVNTSTDKKPEQPNQTQATQVNNTPATSGNKSSGLSTTLSVIAIALSVGLGAWIYLHGHNQGKNQLQTIAELQAKLDKLEPQLATMQQNYAKQNDNQQNNQIVAQQQQLQQQLKQLQDQQQQMMANVANQSNAQLEQFKALQNKVSMLSTKDANLWLLAEADFLVKQASRKLNTEKDITSAIALLTSADASIRDMNDPSLHELRTAMARDISTLSSIKRIDMDGTIIKLYQLSEQLDKMALIKNELDDAPAEPENLDISDNISDWQENLSKSYKSFISDFITVTPIENRVSDTDKPELTANQGAYLRENIRLQLLIAAQAVPGYQSETYHQALTKALSWVKQYYEPENSINQAFLNDLEQLQKQNISVEIPGQLSSQPLLNKLVDARLRNLLTQNATPADVAQ